MSALAAGLANVARQIASGRAHEAEELLGRILAQPTGDLLQAAADVLSNDADGTVQYFAADVLKKVAIRDWATMDPSQRKTLLAFPAACAVRRQGAMASANVEQLFHLSAVFWKLAFPANATEADAAPLIASVWTHLSGGNLATALGLLRHLVAEFSSASAGALGLTWDRHERARVDFQRLVLPKVFAAAFDCGAFEGVFRRAAAGENARVRESWLRLVAEHLLAWDFRPRSVEDDNSDASEVLRPGKEWFCVLANQAFVTCLIRAHADGAAAERHLIQEAVVSLCGLSGSVFPSPGDRISWLEFAVGAAFELAQRATAGYTPEKGGLLHSSCRALCRTALASSPELWYKMPAFPRILSDLTDLTVMVAAQHGAAPLDPWITESLDSMLFLWVTHLIDMLDDSVYSAGYKGTPDERSRLKDSCKRIFEAYFSSQRAAPQPVPAGQEDDDYTAHEQEFAQSTAGLAAVLGRQVPDECFSMLAACIESFTAELAGLATTARPPPQFHDLLHVAICLGMAASADPNDGEVPGIPLVLVRAARKQEGKGDPTEVNSGLRFVKRVFTLADVLLRIEETPQRKGVVSPLVVSALMSGLSNWAASYICPSDDANLELSPVFTTAFGDGRDAVETIVGLCHQAFAIFGSDPDVTRASLSALRSIACKRPLQAYLPVNSPAWANLAADEMNPVSRISTLPLPARRKLMECLCLGSGKASFMSLLPSLEQSVNQALSDLAKTSKAVGSAEVDRLLVPLARIRGVAESSVQDQSRQDIVFQWIKNFFPTLLQLAEHLHFRSDVVTTLFELLSDLVKAQHAYVEPSRLLLECCLSMIQVFCKHSDPAKLVAQVNRKSVGDDVQDTLMAVMLLLQHIVNWDLLCSSSDAQTRRIDTGGIVLVGLHYLIGIINPDFMSHADLSLAFFRLLDSALALYSSKLDLVPEALVHQLVAAIQRAIASPQTDLISHGARSITALCSFCKLGTPAATATTAHLPSFLSQLLSSTVKERLPPYALPHVSRAVFALSAFVGPRNAMEAAQKITAQRPHEQRILVAFSQALSVVEAAQGQPTREAVQSFQGAFENLALTCMIIRI